LYEHDFYLHNDHDQLVIVDKIDYGKYIKIQEESKLFFELGEEEENKNSRKNTSEIRKSSMDEDSMKNYQLNESSYIEEINNSYTNFKQCPYCHNYIENTGGSKFITCYSFICKGNKYFCWNCTHKLYINDRERHFGVYGVYSEFCVNKSPH
jgi:hypothetical protein